MSGRHRSNPPSWLLRALAALRAVAPPAGPRDPLIEPDALYEVCDDNGFFEDDEQVGPLLARFDNGPTGLTGGRTE